MKDKKRKPATGYKKKNKKKREVSYTREERKYLSNLVTPFGKKVPIGERIIKFFIYIGLRLVIRPKKWTHPEKNFEIIDRTYKRIMSPDFSFIPSSIALYFIMAFMPIITLIIVFLSLIPNINDNLEDVFKGFIPGAEEIIHNVKNVIDHESAGKLAGMSIALFISTFISLWIASSGFSKLIYTQSYLYNHKYVGGYWMNRLKGMFIVLSISLFFAIAIIINSFMVEATSEGGVFGERPWLRKTFLYIGLVVAAFMAFIALFKLTPRYKIKIRHILPGAMIATIPTVLFLSLYGLIISQFMGYDRYGPMGSIMYVAASALTISYFMFIGLVANVAYYNTFIGKRLKKKKTLSRK